MNISSSWKAILEKEFSKPYFSDLSSFIEKEIQTYEIYPPAEEIFNAFASCSFEQTRVVIIGQDPYHGANQANGLCFSVKDGIKTPPSLINIFKEIKSDIGCDIPISGNLERWSKQGVLLLNSVLTVRASSPGSHANRGWETFTDAVIKQISDQKENVVFLLWGAYAQKKGRIIDPKKHYILSSPHPSPFSAHRGFLGNKHFSKANNYLKSKEKEEICW